MNVSIERPPAPVASLVREDLLTRYGSVISARDMQRELAFRSPGAFARAVREGNIGFATFSMPGRTGRFALTADLASWLVALRSAGPNTEHDSAEDARTMSFTQGGQP